MYIHAFTRLQECKFVYYDLMLTLGTVWDHFGVTLGLLWGHFGITLGTLWASFWGHFVAFSPGLRTKKILARPLGGQK